MRDVFTLLNEIPHISNGNPEDDQLTENEGAKDLDETTKFRLLTATMCSCVLAYAQYNNQRNPENPQETLRKSMSFCDKLMKENLLSQDDADAAINEVKAAYPATRPSLIKRIIASSNKIYKRYVPNMLDENGSLKEEHEGKSDKIILKAIHKAVSLCGAGSGFSKFLGLDESADSSGGYNPSNNSNI